MRPEELRDFELTDSQKMIRAMARDFARKEITPNVQQWEKEGRYPRDIVTRMGELGFLGAFISEEYGGAGLDHLSYGIICEEIAYADWVCASIISVQNSLVENGILHFGTEEQKQRYLIPLAKGEMQASSALSEPSGGTDLASLQTTAKLDGDHYVLNGQKTFCSHASHTNVYFTLATVDKSLGRKGICAFLVENPSPGMEVTPLNMSTMKRGNIAQIFFDDVRVPKENLLGEEGQGMRIVGADLAVGRFSVAARCVGQAQACLDAALNYAAQREIFGKKESEFQMVKQMIADMVVSIDTARLLVYRLGRLMDANVGRLTSIASVTKLYASEVATKAALDAIQLHGGYGFVEDYAVGRYLLEAKVLEVGEGNSQLHREIIADWAFGIRDY
ncbi:MAG: acyl-CoA dehydrogenase family protein [Dehalococcoidales bacterium]|nr:acyl-CoA dehydrogenase family protein [Dehalococcoidales bacterium]